MTRTVRKYLNRYAQEEAGLIGALDSRYDNVLVVPALDESPQAVMALAAVPGTLVIVVVNASEGRSPSEHRGNDELLRELGAAGRPWALHSHCGAGLLVVDRASPGRRLPEGQGVGLARRIGSDIALALITEGVVASRWIHSTDADVVLPTDYFHAAADEQFADALCYRFWHDCDIEDETGRALAHYEVWLRYYVAMLRATGSRYGVHSIGSTLAIDATSYARVRGFPRRLAGEDFYLINKILKLGRVTTPKSQPIRILARQSSRAPFGTGAGTRRLGALLQRGEQPRLLAPRTFFLIERFLAWLDRTAESAEPAWTELESDLGPAVEHIGSHQAVTRVLATTSSTEARREALHHWFDALKSLQLAHALRDSTVPAIPWTEAIAAMGGPTSDVNACRRWLAAHDSGGRVLELEG